MKGIQKEIHIEKKVHMEERVDRKRGSMWGKSGPCGGGCQHEN